MGEPEVETERPSAQRGLVPDPVDLQDPFKPLRHSLDHVADLVPPKAVQRAVLTGIGRALPHGFALRHSDRDVRRDRPREGPSGPFTNTFWASTWTSTPCGMGTGCLPIRDIDRPYQM